MYAGNDPGRQDWRDCRDAEKLFRSYPQRRRIGGVWGGSALPNGTPEERSYAEETIHRFFRRAQYCQLWGDSQPVQVVSSVGEHGSAAYDRS